MRESSPAQLREQGAGQQRGRLRRHRHRAPQHDNPVDCAPAQDGQERVQRGQSGGEVGGSSRRFILAVIIVQLTEIQRQRGGQVQRQLSPAPAHALGRAPGPTQGRAAGR